MKGNKIFRCLCLCVILSSILSSLVLASSANADILEDSLREQLDELGLNELTRYVELVEPEYRDYLPGLDWRDIIAQGGHYPDLTQLFRLFIHTLFNEIVLNSYLLRQLLVISILSAFFHQIQVQKEEKSLVDLAFSVCFLILIFVGLQSFRTVVSIANSSLQDMVSFMYALLPLMSTLLAAVGGVTSAAIFHPVLVAVVGGIAGLARSLLFPIIYISAILGLLAHFSPILPLSRLAGLAKQVSVMLLTLFFTLFFGVLAVRGAIAPVADGIALRTAKFLTSSLIPVVGGMFSNAVEVVVGGSLLIKNTVGVFGLLLIFFMVALPIIKIWAIILIYKLVGALIQPICDQRLVDALASLESSLTMIFVSLAMVALMFFLSIVTLVGFGNLAAVMR